MTAKKIILAALVAFTLYIVFEVALLFHFESKLDECIENRISLKDSVYKYEALNDFISSHFYRSQHAHQTVLMYVYYEKAYGEEFK